MEKWDLIINSFFTELVLLIDVFLIDYEQWSFVVQTKTLCHTAFFCCNQEILFLVLPVDLVDIYPLNDHYQFILLAFEGLFALTFDLGLGFSKALSKLLFKEQGLQSLLVVVNSDEDKKGKKPGECHLSLGQKLPQKNFYSSQSQVLPVMPSQALFWSKSATLILNLYSSILWVPWKKIYCPKPPSCFSVQFFPNNHTLTLYFTCPSTEMIILFQVPCDCCHRRCSPFLEDLPNIVHSMGLWVL